MSESNTNVQPTEEDIKKLNTELSEKNNEVRELKFSNAKDKYSRDYDISKIESAVAKAVSEGKDPDEAFILSIHRSGLEKLEKKVVAPPVVAPTSPSGDNLPVGSPPQIEIKPKDENLEGKSESELYALLKEEEKKGNVFWSN